MVNQNRVIHGWITQLEFLLRFTETYLFVVANQNRVHNIIENVDIFKMWPRMNLTRCKCDEHKNDRNGSKKLWLHERFWVRLKRYTFENPKLMLSLLIVIVNCIYRIVGDKLVSQNMTNQVSRINIFYLFFFLGEQSTGQFDWGFSKRGWASYAIRQIA